MYISFRSEKRAKLEKKWCVFGHSDKFWKAHALLVFQLFIQINHSSSVFHVLAGLDDESMTPDLCGEWQHMSNWYMIAIADRVTGMRMCKQSGVRQILKGCKECTCVCAVKHVHRTLSQIIEHMGFYHRNYATVPMFLQRTHQSSLK